MTATKQWFAIYTRSRNEKKVYESLTRQGVEAYLPLRVTLRQWSDRKKKVEVPVIASYVFVKINLKLERETIFYTPGFLSFVAEKSIPKPIPESEIETMRRTIDNSMTIEVSNTLLTKGQNVRITSGPLAGIEGVVLDVNKHKINILLKTIGITLVTELSGAEIVPVKKNE
ncbi:MAG: UpxY family transcription antiterminator [Bacteroidales bacterium]|nr:UpxY family transcription antiterminator [Bacteroidales bacterium]